MFNICEWGLSLSSFLMLFLVYEVVGFILREPFDNACTAVEGEGEGEGRLGYPILLEECSPAFKFFAFIQILHLHVLLYANSTPSYARARAAPFLDNVTNTKPSAQPHIRVRAHVIFDHENA